MPQAVDFIVDMDGTPKAAIVDMTIWQAIVELLETLDEAQLGQTLQKVCISNTIQPNKIEESQTLPPDGDPLLNFIGAVSHGHLAQNIETVP